MSVVTKFFLSLRQRIEHYYDIRRLEFRIGSTSVVVAFYFILFYSFLEREERGSCIYSSDNNQFCPIWSVSYSSSSSSPSLCYSSILCLGIRIVKQKKKRLGSHQEREREKKNGSLNSPSSFFFYICGLFFLSIGN